MADILISGGGDPGTPGLSVFGPFAASFVFRESVRFKVPKRQISRATKLTGMQHECGTAREAVVSGKDRDYRLPPGSGSRRKQARQALLTNSWSEPGIEVPGRNLLTSFEGIESHTGISNSSRR